MTAAAHVVVVGGGFAGLAAAVRLARGGAGVTLLERRPFLGGRTYSFTHPATGEVLDNGPHVLMGAYRQALDFLAEIGASDKVAVQPRLHVAMAHPRLGMGAVSAPAVPGLLQAPAALLGYGLLSARDRVRLFAGALRLAARSRERLAGETVAQALAAVGQTEAARERFWDPLAIATLNEAPEIAAAAPFVAVLRRGFFAGAKAARFVVARVPLSEAYTTDAHRTIERAGGRVLTGAPVTGLALGSGGVGGVVLRDGSVLAADAVVLAVPCAALLRLLPTALRSAPAFRTLGDLGTSPIVSTHLWLDRRVAWGSAFLGLLASRAQWLFDCGPAAGGGQRVASVTSGARFWDETPDDEIAREVMDDARAVLPALRDARCVRAHVIRERHATLSLTPAADARRPTVETSVPNLFLAGDWVQTGLPATIEGAVQSGRRAADLALCVHPRSDDVRPRDRESIRAAMLR